MERRSARAIVLCFITLCLFAIPSAAQWIDRPPRPVPRTKPPDSILVRFKPGMTPLGLKKMTRLASRQALPSMKFRREIPKLGIQVFRLRDAGQVNRAVTELKKMQEVLYAEPAYRIILLVADPNDFYFNRIDSEHALFPENEWLYQWPLHTINAVPAWSVWPNTYYTAATKPLNAVKVAVIDTGIDPDHPDFVNAGGASTDILNGGQLDLQNSRNMLNGGDNPDPDDPSDDYGHGTHVAGIIGAATNNSEGVAAIGYNSQIMALKVTDPSGDGDDADVIDAMVWAADHGAQIINLSLAVNGGYSQGLQDAVNYCWLKNTLVVAAAGNDGVDYVRRYPAACNKVLAVAATTFANASTIPPYETQASYSNMGLYIGIGAPSGDATFWSGGEFGFVPELNTITWSTTPTYPVALTESGLTESPYGYLYGTSMAAPHVAGLAALYAGFKGYTQATSGAPRQIIRAIQRGADNIAGRADGGWTIAVGHGRINALATMQEVLGTDRGSTPPGCITGQVTYYGTAVANASITAIKVGTTRKYLANSKEDGTYRVANVPAGDYNVTSQFFGLIKSAQITVESGCDTPATDFEMDASGVTVTVTPHTATVPPGGSQQFSATVTGAANTGVLWSVVEGPGTITNDGIYQVPANTTTPGTAEIQATSLADPTKFDLAEVTITTGLSGVTFQWNPIRGGNTVNGTVTLSGTAPAGGALVLLSSSNTNLATVPANVTVPAGSASATFPVTTFGVATTTFVDITATYASSARTGRLQISPAAPEHITFSPNPVRGGTPVTGTLILNGKAPTGGLVVVLGTETPTVAAPVNATVTVPAGQGQVNFPINTFGVSTQSLGIITAEANGVRIRIGLTVTQTAPEHMTFNPNPVRGGNPVTGTLILNGVAPAGGVVVALGSEDTTLATVPATVTVPAGANSAQFPITTYGTATARMAVITASVNGVNIRIGFMVFPAAPEHITYNPNPVKGGNPTTATLYLNGKAPTGGLVVQLQSENTAVATVPASVTVPAGGSTATFVVNTSAVTIGTNAVIRASANGVTIRIAVSVSP
jgi:subtilisin family serine protease